MIKFNQKASLKPFININTELKNANNNFEKIFFQADEQCSFCKSHGKFKKTQTHQAYDNQKRRSKLVLEPNHKTTKWFSQNLVLTEKKYIKK